mmetsp:Transcript_84599/g.213382  ORF Transcript_84599/g.213382 Transcript_84599/m.213382 type:complete len:1627 (+) Transcript_84599:102-4982(+)
MPQCAPTWYKPELNQTECPFGREFLWDISVPNVWYPGYPGLSQFSVVIFVGYSIVPFAVTLLGVVYFLRAACGRPWGTRVWEAGKPLHPDDGWRLRNMQEAVKMFGFCTMASLTKWLLAFPLGFIYDANGDEQRWIFLGAKRPDKSCLTTCGMPNGQSLWSYGLLTYFFMELCFRLNLPLLIQRRTYTKEMATLLAVRAIPTRTFVIQIMTLFFFLVPVPMSRIILSDASPEQAIFGIVAGIILAVLYHSLYMCLFKDSTPTDQSLAVRLRRCLALLAMYLESSIAMCFFCHRQHNAGHGQNPGTELGNPLCDSQDQEAQSVYLLPQVDPMFVETDHRIQVQQVAPRREGQRTAWHCCQCLAGFRGFFEFIFINSAAAVAEMNARVASAEQHADAVEAERQQEMNFICSRASVVTACLEKLQAAIGSGEVIRLEKAVNETHSQLRAMQHETLGGRAQGILPQLNDIVAKKQDECEKVMSEWKRSLDSLKARVKQVLEAPETTDVGTVRARKLNSDAESVFRCMMAAIKIGIDLPKSAPATVKDAKTVLMNWQSVFTCTPGQRKLIEAIISNVMTAEGGGGESTIPFRDRYGDLTFTELCFCLQTVQKSDSKSFIREGMKLVKTKYPKDLQATLEYLNTLVFLLDYTEKEDIDTAKRLFRDSNADTPEFLKKMIERLCGNAAMPGQYVENEAFLQSSDLAVAKEDPKRILDQITHRGASNKLLATFRDIFVILAGEQHKQYGVLMAPHHTQAIALLIFREFLQGLLQGFPDLGNTKALIARVATGEGKSMLIAAQAAFVALSKDKGGLGKRVHVVGTDERLVSRDFKAFEQVLFQKMGIKAMCLCRDSKGADAQTWRDVWEYDVVYCLPHHLSLLYTQEVTSGGSKLDNFKDCVLLIDEVDALVIDRSPTDMVIDNHQSLSEYAMEVGIALHLQNGKLEDLAPKRGQQQFDEKQRVYKIVQQKWKQAKEIKRAVEAGKPTDFLPSTDVDDAGWIAKDPKSGLPDKSKQSTQLEILRFAHRLRIAEPDVVRRTFPMKWFEPLFVMSKPLVFGRYCCILGFSGTLGNDEEKQFLQDAYKCTFLDVPEFLRTCQVETGEAFHTAEWTTPCLARTESVNVKKEDFPQQAIEVLPDERAQLKRVRQLAFRARRHVPVLVIAGSSEQAKDVVEELREEAQRSGSMEEWDVVRDLSFTQWERSKMDYKDNLFLATQRVGLQAADPWRITVTDASGGRGTDYKIYDAEADKLGGLLLIVMKIPLSSREWTQYQGRTARQDRRGQMCAVLCAQDYMEHGRALPDGAYVRETWVAPTVGEAEAVVKNVTDFGTKMSREALQESRRELVAGWSAHEVCELACKRREGLPRESADFLRWIKDYRYEKLDEMAVEAQKFMGAVKIPASTVPKEYVNNYTPEARPDQGRGVVFALDVSRSMNDPVEKGAKKTRLQICKDRAERLLTNDVDDEDVVGVLLFASKLSWVVDSILVEEGREAIRQTMQQAARSGWDIIGGTKMRDAIVECHKKLDQINVMKKWQASRNILIVLTDGGDGNSSTTADALAAKLGSFRGTLVLITVGLSSQESVEFEAHLQKWQAALGGRARHFKADWKEDDLDKAFEKVRDILDEGVAGLDLSAS